MEEDLDVTRVALLMNKMGFLQQKLSVEQDDQLDDLYTLLKQNKDQVVNAENLQNILLVISGQRDQQNEIPNDIQNKKWMTSGVYDKDTGLFFIREGEHAPIQQHFNLLKINRLQQKKALKNYQHKKEGEKPKYNPKIS